MGKRKSRDPVEPITPDTAPGPADPPPAQAEAPPPLRLEWRSPAELAENPRNWRTHPPEQLAALTDVLAEVGWAGACLYNERTGRLIDGHGRRKIAIDQGAPLIPVLVGSWSEEQEGKILATLDPIAGLAGADKAKVDALLASVQTDSDAVNALLASIARDAGLGKEHEDPPATSDDDSPPDGGDQTGKLKTQFQVLVILKSETEQAQLLQRLAQEGFECRSLIS